MTEVTEKYSVANRRGTALRLAGFAAIFFFLLAFDRSIYLYLHDHYNVNTRPVPEWLRLPTRLLRSLEDWGENVFIVAVLFAIWQLDRGNRSRVLCLVVSAGLVTIGAETIKRIAGRERPDIAGGHTVLRGPRHGNRSGDWHSFPSGHTASAGSFSGSLAAFYPPLRPVCIALAAGCGASRVWKERHFASDCWFGGAAGFWLAATLAKARWMRRLCRRFDALFSTPEPQVRFVLPTAGSSKAA